MGRDEMLALNEAAVASLLFTALATAQPTFEVASIKPNTSGDRSSFSRNAEDSLVLQNWPLREIILKAYNLKDYALTGPDWLASLNFDINAKAGGKVTEIELRQMLQSLLAERFQMKAHPAIKEVPAYVLLPAKGGFKLKQVDDGVFGVDQSRFPGKTRIACRHCSIDNLANVLSGHVDRAIVDQSGIPSAYSFTLEWSPNQDAADAGPSIFTALTEQLGLRLEPRKAPVAILVVDSISKTPTGN
jgi:uncharacterized protein (TIGR03435 family)